MATVDSEDAAWRLDAWVTAVVPLAAFGVASNALLLLLAAAKPQLRRKGTLLLLSLALADLFTMATTLSYTLVVHETGDMAWSESTVNWLGLSTTCTLSWSMLTLTCIAKERYRRIVQERKVDDVWLRRHALAAFGISLVFASLPLVGLGLYTRRQDSPYCMTSWTVRNPVNHAVQQVVFMVEGWGCMLWIVAAYVLMHRKVARVLSAVGGSGSGKAQARQHMSVAWRSAVIVTFFAVMWAPYITMMMYEIITREEAGWTVDFVSTLMSQSNSALNPIVVLLVDKRFNAAARRAWRGTLSRSRSSVFATSATLSTASQSQETEMTVDSPTSRRSGPPTTPKSLPPVRSPLAPPVQRWVPPDPAQPLAPVDRREVG